MYDSYVACVQLATHVRMDLRMDGRYDLRYSFHTDFPTMERCTYEYETLTFLCSLPYLTRVDFYKTTQNVALRFEHKKKGYNRK